MHLDPKHLTLHNMLQGRIFHIPDFQRAYSWGHDQRYDLFDDIREVYRSGRDHFMATVVTLVKGRICIGADEFHSVEIIDGQQRLTTLVILLRAVEKGLNSNNPEENKVKRNINELLIKGDDHSIVLFQTNFDSSSIFLDYLREGKLPSLKPSTAADRNLADAIKESELFVKEWQQGISLIELVAILRNRVSLIYHELTEEETVYRVFEVLNSRGLAVRWIDKLKSQLMASIFEYAEKGTRAAALGETRVIWQDIYRTLGLNERLGDEALRFAGTWKSSKTESRLLSEEASAKVLMNEAGKSPKKIIKTARWLKDVVTAAEQLEGQVRLRAVTDLIQARFLALAIILSAFSAADEQNLLKRWEKVTFRIFCLGGADKRNKVGEYVRLGQEILQNQLSPFEIIAKIKQLGSDYSIGDVLEDADWSESYEGWAEQLRYLLFRYDEYLAQQAGVKLKNSEWNKVWSVDPSSSIEHIQPQSSGKSYIHHLGNLTMLPPKVNSSLKDLPPKSKAQTYVDCGLLATASVGKMIILGSWDKKAVEKRAAEIEQFIRKEWAD